MKLENLIINVIPWLIETLHGHDLLLLPLWLTLFVDRQKVINDT